VCSWLTAHQHNIGHSVPSADPKKRTLEPKLAMDRMTCCRDIAIQNFPGCEVSVRSVVGWLSVYTHTDVIYFSLLHWERSTRGVEVSRLNKLKVVVIVVASADLLSLDTLSNIHRFLL